MGVGLHAPPHAVTTSGTSMEVPTVSEIGIITSVSNYTLNLLTATVSSSPKSVVAHTTTSALNTVTSTASSANNTPVSLVHTPVSGQGSLLHYSQSKKTSLMFPGLLRNPPGTQMSLQSALPPAPLQLLKATILLIMSLKKIQETFVSTATKRFQKTSFYITENFISESVSLLA
jgi:hypothetical protein